MKQKKSFGLRNPNPEFILLATLNSYHSNVVEKKHKCQNPECKKPITIYWYAPLDYFIRV
ncbi:hypothetical protein IMZ68_03630 [Candidatus Bathyarchaeota archaeon]|nr:hypothetical protein [Candidatus Bathyarchaeota archaeon]